MLREEGHNFVTHHTEIKTVDLWNMKNRSIHLFGADLVKELPDIGLAELSELALYVLRNSSYPSSLPKVELVLSELIWSVSWAARMLMLARGVVCDSKREALMWLSQEYIEIRELIDLLLGDFYCSDSCPISITSSQGETLRVFVLELLIREGKSPSQRNLNLANMPGRHAFL